MLNPIDSFFQYFVKRTFSICCFFSKKNALHKDNGKCCFISCLVPISFLAEKNSDRGLKFDY